LAAANGHTKVVEYLIEECQFAEGFTEQISISLPMAAEKGHFEIVKILMRIEGIDADMKNDDGKTAYQLSYRNGHLEIAQYLLKNVSRDEENQHITFWLFLIMGFVFLFSSCVHFDILLG